MSSSSVEVLTIGNAIVDVIARADEGLLTRHGMAKGSMRLIDEATAELLLTEMGQATIVSGGSAGNTAVGVASLGGRAAFMGKVRDDDLGRLYADDIGAVGVAFPTRPAVQGPATARSFILVTPDGERTMNTYLGACTGFGPGDIDEETVRSAAFTYMEGYLWDPPAAKEAFLRAAAIAHAAGRQVALTLSDAFCVDRYRGEFLNLMRTGIVDLVFANDGELRSLYETASLDAAIAAVREERVAAVVTRSADDALLVDREAVRSAPSFHVERVVDSTGAGDLFAAGFLFGRARGFEGVDCLRLGALAAAEVIQHVGARPQTSLKALAAAEGFAM